MRAYEILEDEEIVEGPKSTDMADPQGKKVNPGSAAHRKLHPPGTNYSKKPNQKKYGRPGANDGFVG